MTLATNFEQLSADLLADPDLDVSVDGYSLFAKGRRFAYLQGESLVVRLPGRRAQDLTSRGVAETMPTESQDQGWVRVRDADDWPELAAEAHALAQGHPAGRQS